MYTFSKSVRIERRCFSVSDTCILGWKERSECSQQESNLDLPTRDRLVVATCRLLNWVHVANILYTARIEMSKWCCCAVMKYENFCSLIRIGQLDKKGLHILASIGIQNMSANVITLPWPRAGCRKQELYLNGKKEENFHRNSEFCVISCSQTPLQDKWGWHGETPLLSPSTQPTKTWRYGFYVFFMTNNKWRILNLPSQLLPMNQSPHSQWYLSGSLKCTTHVPLFLHGTVSHTFGPVNAGLSRYTKLVHEAPTPPTHFSGRASPYLA